MPTWSDIQAKFVRYQLQKTAPHIPDLPKENKSTFKTCSPNHWTSEQVFSHNTSFIRTHQSTSTVHTKGSNYRVLNNSQNLHSYRILRIQTMKLVWVKDLQTPSRPCDSHSYNAWLGHRRIPLQHATPLWLNLIMHNRQFTKSSIARKFKRNYFLATYGNINTKSNYC